jgi:DNA-binding transcriptional LysR family regulator
VRELEEKLGVDLFERLPRGVKLTDAGKAMALEFSRILSEIDGMPQRAREMKQGLRGRLRMGMNEAGVSCAYTNRIIREFRSSYPMVSVEVYPMHSRRQLDSIDRGEIDVGLLLRTYVDQPRFDHIELSPLSLSIAVYNCHPLARLNLVSVNDLVGETLIFPAAGEEEVPTLLDFMGVRSSTVRTTPSTEVAMQLVATGFGVAPVQSPSVGALNHPDIRILPLKEQPRNLATCLAWSRERMSEPLRNFTRLALKIRTGG